MGFNFEYAGTSQNSTDIAANGDDSIRGTTPPLPEPTKPISPAVASTETVTVKANIKEPPKSIYTAKWQQITSMTKRRCTKQVAKDIHGERHYMKVIQLRTDKTEETIEHSIGPTISPYLNINYANQVIQDLLPTNSLASIKSGLASINDYISLPEYESFHVDFYNVPSSPRPLEKPPDDDVYFDVEPDMGVLTTKVVDDISNNLTRELYVHVPNVLLTLPTLYPVFDTLLPFSSENEDSFQSWNSHFKRGEISSPRGRFPTAYSIAFPANNLCPTPLYLYDGRTCVGHVDSWVLQILVTANIRVYVRLVLACYLVRPLSHSDPEDGKIDIDFLDGVILLLGSSVYVYTYMLWLNLWLLLIGSNGRSVGAVKSPIVAS
ncbi:hypothetical protein Tco_0939297 [Tanacetum coccineum]|uniref:Uncharacterized protein n=1 Tax=Tanacetum coccineum TaxID=301880 RepID=A0ABQ5DK75_9ASTR